MVGFAISAAPAVAADAGACPAISRNAAATEASTNFMIFSKVQYASHLSDVECARYGDGRPWNLGVNAMRFKLTPSKAR